MIDYEIKEKIGVVSKKLNGETLELNLIRYGQAEKYDLRRWNGKQMYKGVTMTQEELNALKRLLNESIKE